MYRILSFLLVLGALSFGFVACDQTPTTTIDPDHYNEPTRAAAAGSTSADPKIVYSTSSTTIGVMDSTSDHQTIVYTASSGVAIFNPNWSPSNSICWVERNSSSAQLRAADISVGSGGVPVASNVRTIVSAVGIMKSAWSSTSSTNKIAFTVHDVNSIEPDHVCLVSASGGAWDTLYQAPAGVIVRGMSWSPDDSKLALFMYTSTWNSFIVINTSTKEVTDSIAVGLVGSGLGGTNNIGGGYTFEWSRAGSMNKLAFVSQNKIYYVTPTSGSTPTTNDVSGMIGGSLTWSPNNSGLIFIHSTASGAYSMKKNKAQSTSVSTLDKSITSMMINWHR